MCPAATASGAFQDPPGWAALNMPHVVTRELAPLPDRALDAHKGDVGRIIIVGGCVGPVMMVGAPALAANAAYRSGAGLVQIITPAEVQATVAGLAPLATTRLLPRAAADLSAAIDEYRADVLAIGPGLGSSLSALAVVEVISRFAGPVVVDADGLNLMARAEPSLVRALPNRAQLILTPHPGEADRLLAAAGSSLRTGTSAADRRAAALALVEAYGGVVVLKGHESVVADSTRLYVNLTGNAGMATGGAGDVLTGMIAALVGQKMPPLEAAMLGVYLHGLAGDFAAEETGRHSLTAQDLIDYLPDVFVEHASLEE